MLTTHDTYQISLSSTVGLVERVMPLFSLDGAPSILMIISIFVSAVTNLIALAPFQSDGEQLTGCPFFSLERLTGCSWQTMWFLPGMSLADDAGIPGPTLEASPKLQRLGPTVSNTHPNGHLCLVSTQRGFNRLLYHSGIFV
jgi:hypothetical protein